MGRKKGGKFWVYFDLRKWEECGKEFNSFASVERKWEENIESFGVRGKWEGNYEIFFRKRKIE